MAKGSQLSQLKSALSQAGITGKPQNNNKRKRSGSTSERDKEKKAAKLQEIHQKLNPFDVKVTKLKHDVGGRKLKGVTGKPAQSRQAGIEQRKKTLLKEYEERNHAGGILDRRFGENDPTMTPEERMLERFTRERQRAAKGSAFNLDDEDELTHYGQSLSKLDDFDATGMQLDDDDDEEEGGRGQIDRDIVKKAHFGGFDDDEGSDEDEDGEPARKKSKAEVMAEVIAKSKMHKAMRQNEKEAMEDIRHELDQGFDELRGLLFAVDPSVAKPPAPSTEEDAPKADDAAPSLADPAAALVDNDPDYDRRVRELAFDKRAKAKDRTKTEEELALEEKEALEKAERRRQKRMMGLEESVSEDEGGGKGKKRKRGGDDLEDDFDYEGDSWGGIGAGLGGEDEEEGDGAALEDDDEDEEGDEGEGSDEEDVGDESEEEDGESDSDAYEEVEEGDHEALVTSKKATPKKKKAPPGSELPFTFPCPSSHDEFLEIVDGIADKDVPTVVQRIRTLYHPSLGVGNKAKLQVLTNVLIDHALYVTAPPHPNYTLLNSVLPHLCSLIKAFPTSSASYFVEKLVLMDKNLRRGLSNPLDPNAKTWPGTSELSLLRILGAVWSTSDLHHVVVSPARLLMGSYLGLARVRSLSDIASGLFLCTLFYQFEEVSKRLVPEAINFLASTIVHLSPNEYKDVKSLPGNFPTADFHSELTALLRIKEKTAKKIEPSERVNLAQLLSTGSPTVQDKVDHLTTAIELLRRFAVLYKGLDAFVELYQPMLELVENIDAQRLSSGLQTKITTFRDEVRRLLKFAREARKPLLLQAHKPIPLATFVPKFESTSSSFLKHSDPDKERKEAAKLRAQYKQERKGAIRELRKDARFLAGVQQEKQKAKDNAYKDSMNRVFGSLESERAEQKRMDREKQKVEKRAGKK
ncbi:Nop14-like protein [Schizophyllum commune H4-8]|uniref:Nop14-like protein n=1 Tax=Schizophyllum commune (strain H4-8 / FGSC 9210) TaxID=578458 RepID=D8PQG0_SCHCM|nr:Nop14-like protein [Schizophyllum commune H4-8]KAI5893598.1 Nop14-like protein [Schizophyllum commune H4-8]